ncbi:MAG: PAS domain-containing sensor histidine kinase [Acidobacteria bacterium]|nr:PAS domain-containing sensor histidine kinase [Acidobacteriota bacterium]
MPLPGPIPENAPVPETESELREHLQAVTASERRLRQLMNADPFAFLIGTTGGEVRYMNPALREMLGYSAAEVERGGVRWDKLTPPEFADRDLQAIQELQQHGRCRLYEKEFIAHDGRRVPILLGASVISDAEGGEEVAVFIADLSALQHAQKALRERDVSIAISDERSRQLLRANPFGMTIGRPDGRVEYANESMLHMLGYTSADIDTGKLNFWEITAPEHLAISRAAVQQVLQTGSCPAYEKDYFHRDGHRISVLVGSTLIPNLEGGYDIASFITDLTELKKTQRALEASQKQLNEQFAELETLYQTAPIGLAFFDPKEYRYLRLNDAQAKIVGKPKSEILGKTLTEIAPIEGLRELFDSVAAGKPLVNYPLEGELPERPGEHRHWTVNYFPVFSQTGELTGITAASLEVTDIHRAENALRESEKLAAVGRLASSISHEINNPLEAITNLLYLARHETDEQKRNEYLDTAQHEVGRVSQIATQTLRFHRQPGRPSKLTAGELIDPVIALYAGRLANSGIRIERRYISTTTFRCMEGDMRQVMNNLIGNAIDAMRGTGGVLHVRSLDTVDPHTGQPQVRITVADTGYGMTDETRRRAFDPFYTTKGISGTGLGLWISKGIVDKHSGKLRVRSCQQPGHTGTVFHLYMPVHSPLSDGPHA